MVNSDPRERSLGQSKQINFGQIFQNKHDEALCRGFYKTGIWTKSKQISPHYTEYKLKAYSETNENKTKSKYTNKKLTE